MGKGMFAPERRQKIIDIVERVGSISISDLSRRLAVSGSCVRKDLRFLEAKGLIERTHGGVLAKRKVRGELTLEEKESEHAPAKARVARAARAMIKDGDTIWLDGGSTNLMIAKELSSARNLTVLTNSLAVAQELLNSSGVEVIICGGMLRRVTTSIVGPFAHALIERVNLDKAFIGLDGISLDGGCTVASVEDAETKRRAIERAIETIVVFDSSKFGKVAFAQ